MGIQSRFLLIAALVSTFVGCAELGVDRTSGRSRNNAPSGSRMSMEQARIETRLEAARDAYRALLTAQDGGAPEALLESSTCVAVLPNVVKAAFIGGGRWGRGVVTCRDDSGGWSPPAFIELAGGSVGWQIGAESANIVLFFTGRDAKRAVVKDTGLSLGADLSIAAGPIGRRADVKTDFSRAAIFSYAQSQGLFAGVSLEGTVISPDWESNRTFYGKTLSTREIISGSEPFTVPEPAQEFLSVLPTHGSMS